MSQEESSSLNKCLYNNSPSVCSTSNLSKLYATQNTIAYFSGYYGGSIHLQTGLNFENPSEPLNSWSKISKPGPSYVSNSAYLPPLLLGDYDAHRKICEDRSADIQDTLYTGRLPSRQEYIFLGQPYEHLSSYHQLQIFNQTDQADQQFSLGSEL